MKSELCKTCIHTDVCMKDKNIAGDTFVAGNPMIFDNKKLYEKFKEREAKGFPCDDYISSESVRYGRVVGIDLISKQAALEAIKNSEFGFEYEVVDELLPVQTYSRLITWLLDEVWDEDLWELNWPAFPELLCRKLVKLGYVKERDGDYERLDR